MKFRLDGIYQIVGEYGLIKFQCGLYRTGSLWAHSALPVDCHPDMITMAKPLANGYPIGAVLLRDTIASTMTTGKSDNYITCSRKLIASGRHSRDDIWGVTNGLRSRSSCSESPK